MYVIFSFYLLSYVNLQEQAYMYMQHLGHTETPIITLW